MAKALKIAAIVVGVAALAVATLGLALGPAAAAAAGSFLGITSVATAATILSVSAAALSFAASAVAAKNQPKLSGAGSSGQQLDFVADPSSGEPYFMGVGMSGADIIHEAAWGDKNRWLGIVAVLSCAGPIHSYDGLYADMTPISFSDGSSADGYYAGFLNLTTQLGNRPEPTALDMTAPGFIYGGPMPDWDADHKTSGLATIGLLLKADVDNNKVYSGGVPKLTSMIHGVLAYDPRLDSSNGIGTGSQRPGGAGQDETDYAFSENPWVHHGTFAIGRWVNGKRVIGPGMPASNIDWASHVEAANVADANGWKISGRISSIDRKWEALKAIAQAGGGYPIPAGARLHALVNTPRVSLATIEEADVKGPITAPQTSSRRDRFNGGIARIRSPEHAWETVSLDAVRHADYLAADRGNERTAEIEYPLVNQKNQAAQLIGYHVANSRERFPITFELSLYWSQYKTGDCLTLNLPSARLFNQKCVIIGRVFNPSSNTVTFQFRTEDDAKHEWALGLTGTAPPPTTVALPPGSGDVGGNLTAVLRASYTKGLRITSVDAGASATINIDGGTAGSPFIIDYALDPPQEVSVGAGSVTGLAYSTSYYVYADVTGALDAAPVYGATTVYRDAINSAAHPKRIYLNQFVTTPAAGGAATGGSAGGGGYGGEDPGTCPVESTLVLMANEALDGPGAVVPMADAKSGHVWTRPELPDGSLGDWGAFPIMRHERAFEPVYRVEGLPTATKMHRTWRDGFKRLHEHGTPDGSAYVIKLTVYGAHTYFTPGGGGIQPDGVINHNIKVLD